jgi:hypothetical protein
MSLSYLLWVIVVILFLAWALGLGGVYRFPGGSPQLVHILLVLVVLIVVVNLLRGRSL